MFKKLAAFPQWDFCRVSVSTGDYPFRKLAVSSESAASCLYIFFSFLFFLAASLSKKKKKSLCHFQTWRTFVFMRRSTTCVSDEISPLSILGTPIDQRQGIEVRGEGGDLENKLFTLN